MEYPSTGMRNTVSFYGLMTPPAHAEINRRAPIAGYQPANAAGRENQFPTPTIAQSVFEATRKQSMVPLAPYTHRRVGANVEGMQLFDGVAPTCRGTLQPHVNWVPTGQGSRYTEYTQVRPDPRWCTWC